MSKPIKIDGIDGQITADVNLKFMPMMMPNPDDYKMRIALDQFNTRLGLIAKKVEVWLEQQSFEELGKLMSSQQQLATPQHNDTNKEG